MEAYRKNQPVIVWSAYDKVVAQIKMAVMYKLPEISPLGLSYETVAGFARRRTPHDDFIVNETNADLVAPA